MDSRIKFVSHELRYLQILDSLIHKLLFFYSIITHTVFPQIVSALEYFPPLNSFHSQNLLNISSFYPWIVSGLEQFP